MAKPTPVTSSLQVGQEVYYWFHATWTDTTDFSDEVVIDLSALTTYTTTLSAKSIQINASPGLGVLAEFNLTADDIVLACALGACIAERDFRKDGLESGLPYQSAQGSDSGDLVVTTTSAAANDELFIFVHAYAT